MENLISALRLLSMFDSQLGGASPHMANSQQQEQQPVPNWHDATDLDARSDQVSGYQAPPAMPTATPKEVPQYQNPEPPVTGSYPRDERPPAPPNPYEGSEGPIHEGLPGQDKHSDIQQLIEAMQPKHRFSDRLYGLLDQMPQKDAHPSVKKRLLQGLFAGVTGDVEGSDRAVNPQYYRDLDRWKQQLGATQIGVNAEDKDDVSTRMMLMGGMRANNAADSLQLRELEHQRKVEKDNNDYQLSRARLNLQRMALENPNYDFIAAKDGNVYAFDRKSQEYHKTDVKAQDLDYETRESIKLKNAESLAVKQSGLRMDEARAKERAKTANPEQATQRKVELYNRAHEYVSKNPKLKDYVTFGAPGTNDFDIEVPNPDAWFNKGPEKDAYDAMIKYIFDEHGIPSPAAPITAPAGKGSVSNKTLGQPPAFAVVKRIKDGQTMKIPFARKQEYLDSGQYEDAPGVMVP